MHREPFERHCEACGRCVRDRVCHSHVLRVCVSAQCYECYRWLVVMCASQNLLLAAYQSLLAFAELVERLLDMPRALTALSECYAFESYAPRVEAIEEKSCSMCCSCCSHSFHHTTHTLIVTRKYSSS